MTVESRVIAIIARQAVLDTAEVTLDLSPAELGLDSLALVEMIFAIEEEFDVSVPFNANDPSGGTFDISSVRAIVQAVEGLIAARA